VAGKFEDIDGERLRELREAQALSQEGFGEKVGISGSQVANIERGRTKQVYLETFASIAKALSLSVEEARAQLLPGSSEPVVLSRRVAKMLRDAADAEGVSVEQWIAARVSERRPALKVAAMDLRTRGVIPRKRGAKGG
jgi:transcriptional regulator with XRE-family HTH domain